MGLITPHFFNLLKFMKEQGVNGKSILMIGKQELYMDFSYFSDTLYRCGLVDEHFSEKCKKQEDNKIDSYSFFKAFGFEEVHALDYSRYEGADIIVNLNETLPDSLIEKYDFVIDGGTLEHVFNVSTAISNLAKLVKVNGWIIHILPCANYVNHGFFSFSPTFFLDFYCANNFFIRDINLLFSFRNGSEYSEICSQDCRLFRNANEMKNYISQVSSMPLYGNVKNYVVAKKLEKTCDYKFPIQSFYQSVYKRANEKEYSISNAVRFISDHEEVSLFCSGQVCKELMKELYSKGLENKIDYIFDSDIGKIGNSFFGKTISYPNINTLSKTKLILICSSTVHDEVYKQLTEGSRIEKEKIFKIVDL